MVGHHHLVYHAAEGDGGVGHLLGCPAVEVGLIVGQVVVGAAVGEQRIEAGVTGCPLLQAVADDIVFVVFEEFLYAGAGYIEELELELHGGDAIGRALDDVLLARACGLHHLVYGAVSVGGKEAAGEGVGHLVEHYGLLIEP